MALEKGLGTCMVPKANGQLCAKQIGEGEPIGSVVLGVQSFVGHKDCVDKFNQRQAEKKANDVVKRVDQSGPGGAVDMANAKDALLGSIPLEKHPDPHSVSNQPEEPSLADIKMPEGVQSVADLPFTEEPEDLWAKGRPEPVPQEVPAMTLEDFTDIGKGKRTEIDNRFRYHPPSPENARIHGLVREKVRDVALLFLDVCPDSAEREAAINALDSAVMLANAAIARHS